MLCIIHTIIRFKLKIITIIRFKLYMILTYIFSNHTYLKYVMFSIYIYIYINTPIHGIRIYLILESSFFTLNNSLATKIKNLDEHVVEN